MPDTKATASVPDEPAPINFTEFLVSVAPNKKTAIFDFLEDTRRSAGKYHIRPLQIMLPCNHPDCGGERNYKMNSNTFGEHLEKGNIKSGFLTFVCCNCSRSYKKYSIELRLDTNTCSYATKYGEVPEFGIYIEPEIEKIVGDYLDTFKKAVVCETKGYGIAAFAYYRRVIEDIKSTLFNQIIQICEKIGAEKELIKELRLAEEEKKFTNSVNKIKQGIPDSLYVDGHNPLTLLHDALSEGLHNDSDAECLELSHAIRAILSSLLKNMDYALKEDKKLKKSVASLLNKRRARVEAKKPA